MRLIFMGTPDFAVPALAALLDAGHAVAAVYCQPPRPAGRGMAPRPSPVQAFAESRDLTLRMPARLKDPAEHERFAALEADAAVVAAYGLILPPPILAAPRHGCINIHASLLPRWRGAAPIHRALLAGDAETGITIMQMEAGLDTGPMLMQRRVPIAPDATAQSLHDTLAALGAQAIVAALEEIRDGTLRATPQKDAEATYAAKLTRDEGRLSWAEPAAVLERKVRGLTPWPGAWFELGWERIKVLKAELAPGRAGAAPGTVLDDRLAIACGEGAFRPLMLQRAGRGALPVEDFLRGFPIAAGTRLD